MKELKLEKEYLDTVVNLIYNRKLKLKDEYKTYSPYIYAVGDMYNDWDFEMKKVKALRMKAIYDPKIRHLKKLEKNPYFGKIVLEKEKVKEEYYIGSEEIRNQKNELVVISWLTEYGDLFYKRLPYEVLSNGDEVEVLKTRNFNIENSRLVDYKDYEIKSGKESFADLSHAFEKYISSEFLQNELVSRNAQKLQPIFQTIDQIQNEVIRMNPAGTLIVQGVSGSGKTTMGLQRLTYIIYQFEKDYKKRPNILALFPNNIFLDYIHELVPNLNLNAVDFKVVEEFFLGLKSSKIKIEQKKIKDDLTYHLTHSLNEEKRTLYSKWFKLKGSKKYAEKLKRFVEARKERLYTLNFNGIHPTLNNEAMIQMLNAEKNLPYNEMLSKIAKKVEGNLKAIQEITKEELKNKLSSFRREINSHKQNVADTYQDFLKSEYIFRDLDLDPIFIELNQQGKVYNEDIPALVYLSFLLNKSNIETRYDHIFVDEGQDMNYIQFLILKYFSYNFTIVGDLNQQIYLQNGIDNWEELSSISDYKFKSLDYNYRSTREIMELATSCLINPTYIGTGVLETGIKPTQYVFSAKETRLSNWRNIINKYLVEWQAKR